MTWPSAPLDRRAGSRSHMESDGVAHHRVPVGRGAVASVAKVSMSEARVLTDGDLCHANVSAWTDEAE